MGGDTDLGVCLCVKFAVQGVCASALVNTDLWSQAAQQLG